MNKRFKIIVVFTLFIFILILTLANPYLIIESVEESSYLFFNSIFLTMFPFFILSDILISYNFPYYIGKVLGKLFNNLFKINKESTIVVILSMLSGHPGNAKYTKVLLDNNIINEEEASKLIAFTYFPNPMFVIGSVGLLFLNDIKMGIYILALIYITNFLIGLFIRNKYSFKQNNISLDNRIEINFGKILKKSIVSSFETLVLILGNITMFTILENIVFKYININIIAKSIISSLIEITGGIKNINELIINYDFKISLIIFSLIFSGFCIHSQVFSILSDYKLNYKFIIKVRLVAALIVSIISSILL
jgi:sporulation integral membrane protein YlbJ